ncbi:Bicyclomycin resistance protein [Marinomonas spartinae]|uniref:Bicyclomycin resistance protein n=1 Tax=Marinomonas spartinae TaxID=1792290 RepID=A0A1A8TR93_9GAMM|nr:multidrug effflux MFS transporter [Marinomonas spartinae]SBS36023.1 Bicyclomycin resistance protein [Marinomonas spartinae]
MALSQGEIKTTQKHLPEKEFILLCALMMSLTALSTDAVLPAFSQIAHALGIIDYQKTQWIISAMIFGMAFGEITFGPLSDVIGRKKSISLGIGIFIIGSVVALWATSLTGLLIGRCIQGFGLAGPKIASRALIRDLYKGTAMARIMSYTMMIIILVPMLAPAFGQLVMLLGNWRWVFGVLIFQALIAVIWLAIRQPETLPPAMRHPFQWARLRKDARFFLSQREVMAYTCIAGGIFGCLMLYLSIAQSIFQDIYQAGTRFPLYFALLAAGSVLTNFFNGKIVQRVGMMRCLVAALSVLLFSSFLLLMIALSYSGKPPFILFMGIAILMFSCFGMIFGNVNAMAMEPLGHMAGLGASMISSISSLVAIVFSVFMGQFYHFTVIPLAAGFTLSASIALVLLVFAKYDVKYVFQGFFK